ncbi:uncharacterized protein C8Q71DRAFT_715676 [Rhodofomes roseus]|uniref:ribonuclease Z n=1 Tax=Rhodofomes roseus TaxID=34475 RepID=A0ABQ8K2U5_9APHY|nr:uncharacterized protein C8Q71DRAFT_715676 [Rhodofomes roseus]KAH9831154.1 hypothetical protein C8Q71DRAFT_715676 [Rhodofomes roseus]
MNWSATVITSATADTEPSIVVTFDDAKYLFNVGENTSRAWLHSNHGWKKTKAIFLTSVDTQRASGLSGLLMFFADSGSKKVSLTGPSGLLHYLASMRLCLRRANMELKHNEVPPSVARDVTPTPVYSDDKIKVYALPIHASTIDSADEALTPDSSVLAKRKRSPSPDVPSKRTPLADVAPEVVDEAAEPLDPYVPPEEAEVAAAAPDDLAALFESDPQEWRRLVIQNMFPFKAPEESQENAYLRRKRELKAKKRRQGYENAGLPLPLELRQSSSSVAPLCPEANAIRSERAWRLPRFAYGPEGKSSLCYVLVGPAGRGRFDAAKAEQLQVPHGAERSRLTRGETITFTVDDGAGNRIERTVAPEECMGPSETPLAMLVFDVPTPSHISELVKSFTQDPFYSKFRSKATPASAQEPIVYAVYHLCGVGVLEDERYKNFMRGFPEDTHHIISSREHGDNRVVFTKAALNQLQLSTLDPDMFPLPVHTLRPRCDLASIPGLPARVHHLYANCHIEMRPVKEPCFDPFAVKNDIFNSMVEKGSPVRIPQNVVHAFGTAKGKIEQVQKRLTRKSRPGDDVEIIPLGSSSATPTAYRNVSSLLVRIPGYGGILLDAGEGTWGQLARMYGDDGQNRATGVWEILRNLRCIFVSHMHGDHHLGLSKILAMRRLMDPAPAQPLHLIGLPSHLMYLQELEDLEDLGLDLNGGNGVKMISANFLCQGYGHQGGSSHRYYYTAHSLTRARNRQYIEDLKSTLGLKHFRTVDVEHKTKCYGAVIEHRDGWSIVYSADTMPSAALVDAGQYPTLLIHEATMGDEEADQARAKGHSTFSQALQIGDDMHAENILLTHFSARYPKIPPTTSLPDSPRASPAPSPHLGLAFDCTKFTIGDMWKQQFYLPAIELNLGDVAKDDIDENSTFSAWD